MTAALGPNLTVSWLPRRRSSRGSHKSRERLLPVTKPGPVRRSAPARCVDAEARGGDFRVAQETGVHAGVAEGQGFAINAHRAVLQRSNKIVAGVLQSV